MRANELQCVHGIGHSAGIHGCDGCCHILADAARQFERESIAVLIQSLSSHMTHSELCTRMHAFAAQLVIELKVRELSGNSGQVGEEQ